MVDIALLLNKFTAPSMSIPTQMVKGASTTHVFNNIQGRQILLNDGYKKEAHLFNIFTDQLDCGVQWVDKGLKSCCHLYDPDSKSGMWLWPNAAEKCSELFNKAVSLWKKKNHPKSMFYLGAALHLVQDLCVPHHAVCNVLYGHQEFEDWSELRKYNYTVEDGGIYDISGKPEDWVAENARQAKKYFPLVKGRSTENNHYTVAKLLPLAQRTSAGFLKFFYNHVFK
ncbi:MAG: phospholipase [Peptococcaceae bacterium]|nr:phospholipase [Peptococcaceae bacterium]